MMLWRIALLSLWQHRGRTLVLGGTIALVTALLLVLLGIGEGMNRSLVEVSTTLVSGHVNVGGFYKVTAGQASSVVTHASQVEAVVRRAVPEATFIASRGRGFGQVVSDSGSLMLGLTGVSVGEEAGLEGVLRAREGALAGLARPDGLLLFESEAAELGVQVGDRLTLSALTARGTHNTVDVTVVVVAEDMGMLSQFVCFVSQAALRQLYQFHDDTTGAFQVYLPRHDAATVRAVSARLRDALAEAGYGVLEEDGRPFWMKFENLAREPWTGQRLDLTTWQDEVSYVSWLADLLSTLSFLLAGALLPVIGVGLVLVMWIAIRERTREIGTLRAIGLQRRGVAALFLAEGFLLGALASTFGAGLGLGCSWALDAAQVPLSQGVQFVLVTDRLVVVPTLQWAAASVAFVTVAVTGISLLPALVAARLSPLRAMAQAG